MPADCAVQACSGQKQHDDIMDPAPVCGLNNFDNFHKKCFELSCKILNPFEFLNRDCQNEGLFKRLCFIYLYFESFETRLLNPTL